MRWLLLLLLLNVPFIPSLAMAAEDCDKARSSADVMKCLNLEKSRAEGELNAAFDLLSMQKSEDGLTAVKETQAQWLRYRDGNCEQETTYLDTESLKRIESLRCRNRLTQERIVALENAFEQNHGGRVIGEASGQSRWMNALAQDYPDVFWRYGSRIEGDLDCDGDTEYMMTGVKQGTTPGDLQTLVSVTENPATGRPRSHVVALPVIDEGDGEAALVPCGLMAEIFFISVATQVAQALAVDMGAEVAHDAVVACESYVTVNAARCAPRRLYATGDEYGFKE